jgi:hypothetical protein
MNVPRNRVGDNGRPRRNAEAQAMADTIARQAAQHNADQERIAHQQRRLDDYAVLVDWLQSENAKQEERLSALVERAEARVRQVEEQVEHLASVVTGLLPYLPEALRLRGELRKRRRKKDTDVELRNRQIHQLRTSEPPLPWDDLAAEDEFKDIELKALQTGYYRWLKDQRSKGLIPTDDV